MFYKKFILQVSQENNSQKYYNRLMRIADAICDVIEDNVETIKKLEDDKNNLVVYWSENPSNLNKLIINSLWMDEKEFYVNHIVINPSKFSNDYLYSHAPS